MRARLLEPLLRVCLVLLEKLYSLTRPEIIPRYPYDRQSNTIRLPREIERELRQLVATGNNVEAIKRVTQLTGAGLRESKDYVDALAAVRTRRR